MEDELEAMEKRKRNLEGAVDRQYNQASSLMEKYDLPPSAFKELMKANNPEHMEDKAEKIALKMKSEKPAAPVKEQMPKPDSGISDAGADDDKSFIERWNSGDLSATKENLARVKKIINK